MTHPLAGGTTSLNEPKAVHVDRGVVVVLLLVPFLAAKPDISGNGTRRRRSEAISGLFSQLALVSASCAPRPIDI